MKFSETHDFCVLKGIDWTLDVECVEKLSCNINIMAQRTKPKK